MSYDPRREALRAARHEILLNAIQPVLNNLIHQSLTQPRKEAAHTQRPDSSDSLLGLGGVSQPHGSRDSSH